jgi:hypothetical protein
MMQVLTRQPQLQELNAVRAVVQTVVDEVYGGLWALPLYQRHGWHIIREFPHEKFPIMMLEMVKSIRQDKK